MFFGLIGNKDSGAAPAGDSKQGEGDQSQQGNQNASTTEPGDKGTATSPLDNFKDLWQPPKDEGQPQPAFAVDQSKIMEAAGKLDFTKLVTSDQVQAIANGGEEAAKAFLQAMNAVSQASFANALTAAVKLNEQALASKEAEFEARLPGAIKSFNIDSSIAQDPVLSHPAAKPVIGAIAKQIARQYPDASVKEVQEHALTLLREMSGAAKADAKTATQPASEDTTAAGDFDWDAWIVK